MSTPFLPLLARPRNRGWGSAGEMWYQDADGIWQSIERPADWATVPYFLGIDQSTGVPTWLSLSGVAGEIVRVEFIASTTQLYPPLLPLIVFSGTIASGAQFFAPNIESPQTITGSTRASAVQFFAPTITGGALAPSKMGSFSFPTSVGGTVTLTFAFEVKLLVLHGNSRTTTSGSAANIENLKQCIGFATGTTSRCNTCFQVDDGVGTSATDRKHSDTAVYSIIGIDGSNSGDLDVDLWDWNGTVHTIRLITDDDGTAAVRIMYWAVGGDDVEAAITMHQEPASTGNHDITVGVTDANLFLFMGAGMATAPTGTHASDTAPHGFQFFGAADADGGQAVFCAGSEDAQAASDCSRYQRTGQCIAMMPDDPNTLDARASFVGVSGTDVTLNWAERTGTRYFFVASIKAPHALVGSVSAPGTLAATVKLDTDFRPTAGLCFSAAAAESTDDTPIASIRYSMGHFANDQAGDTGNGFAGCWFNAENDAAGTTICDRPAHNLGNGIFIYVVAVGIASARYFDVSARDSTGITYVSENVGLGSDVLLTSILVG